MAKKIAEHEIKFLLTAKNETKKAFGKITSQLPSMKTLALATAKAVAAIGVAAALVATTSIVAFADFETALTDMTRVTNDSLGEIKETMLGLAPELGGATELVRGYYNVISAGVTKPQAALDLLTTAAKASNTAHLELDTTVAGITNLMDGFGGSIESATVASDKLFTIERIGKTRFSELAPVIGQVSSNANILGVSLDELGGLFATVTKTAGSTEVAATQVKAIFNSLLRPSADMAKVLDEMGFASARAAIDSRGFMGVLAALNDEIRRENTTIQDLFKNQRALNGIAPAFQNNLQILDDNIGEMANSTGATDEAFKAWSGTLEGLWKTFKNTIGNMAIEFGAAIAPDIKLILGEISLYFEENRAEIIEWGKNLVEATRIVIEAFWEWSKFIKTTVDSAVIKFIELQDAVTPAFDSIMAGIKSFVGGLIDIELNASSMSDAVVKAIKKIRGTGLEHEPLVPGVDPEAALTLKGFGQLIKTIGIALGSGIHDIVDSLFSLEESLQKAKTAFWDWAEEMLKTASNFIADILKKIKELEALDFIKSLFNADEAKKEADKMKVAIEELFVLFEVKSAGLTVSIDTEPVKESTTIIKAELDSIPDTTTVEALVENINALASISTVVDDLESIPDITREINMEIAAALDAIDTVEHKLASIPDVTVKTLVMKVETEASPRRPFSEGMKYIKEKIEDLPGRRGLVIDTELPNGDRGMVPNILLSRSTGVRDPFSTGLNNGPTKVQNTTNQNIELTVNITTKEINSNNIDSITDEIAESLARKLNTGRARDLKQAIREA